MYRSVRLLAITLVMGLVLGGFAFAEMKAHPEKWESVELTGTVLSDNTFIAEDGANYQLADTDKNEELQDLVGKKIKVKASVMENEEGTQEISVVSYDLIQE